MMYQPVRTSLFPRLRNAWVLAAAMLLVPVVANAQSAISYILTEIAPIERDGTTFDQLLGVDLNNRGQVAGRGLPAGEGSGAIAFRYSPDGPPVVVNREPGSRATAYGLNDNGDVYGSLAPAPGARLEHFLYRDGSGLELLSNGITGAIRNGFQFTAMNDDGDVVGIVQRRDGRLVPFRYTAAQGWVNLADRYRELNQATTYPIAINSSGDVAFWQEKPGTPVHETFLLRGGELGALPSLGRRSSLPWALNEAGTVVGSAQTADAQAHAFVFTRDGRLTSLQRERFDRSVAIGVTPDGVVTGLGIRRSARFNRLLAEEVFTFDETRNPQMVLTLRAANFRRFLEPGAIFRKLDVRLVNARLEMIGSFEMLRADGKLKNVFFLFSPVTGLNRLADLIPGGPPEALKNEHIRDLNDRGEVLLRFGKLGDEDDPVRTMILSPDV